MLNKVIEISQPIEVAMLFVILPIVSLEHVIGTSQILYDFLVGLESLALTDRVVNALGCEDKILHIRIWSGQV